MDFSFLLPGIRRKNGQVLKELNTDEKINIFILKDKLIAVGYNPGEVDYWIKSSSNGVDINKLDTKQLQKIEAILEQQLSVANQCIEFVREAK